MSARDVTFWLFIFLVVATNFGLIVRTHELLNDAMTYEVENARMSGGIRQHR